MGTGRQDVSSDVPAGDAPRMLELRTLGALELVERHGESRTTLFEGANKALALFTYLACSPGRGATRTHLQELLWERQTPEAAQQALRTYLWKLRKTIGQDVILGDEFVRLGVPCVVDRDQVMTLASTGDADAVVQAYTGDFFPSYAQPDSPQFDAWVQGERLRLRGIYSRCAERVVTDAVNHGRFRHAIAVAQALRDSDPLDEVGWRPLLSALRLSGDAVSARGEADVLERTLSAEERAPTPATRALIDEIRRDRSRDAHSRDVDTPSANAIVTPLIGRDREFSQLLAAWTRARDGARSHVHVQGAAGVGKSRLLDDLSARIALDRATVVNVRADIGRRSLSYAFVGSVAAVLAAKRGAAAVSPGSMSALIAINPALTSFFSAPPDLSTGDEALRRRTLAFAELLEVLSDERPLVLLLDDLQWADSASCTVIAGAASSLAVSRILLLTASRDDVPSAFANPQSDGIVLQGLSVEAITELVQSLASLPDEQWAQQLPQWLHASTAGQPLLVLDSLRLAMDRQLLSRERQSWQSVDPTTLRELIESGAALPQRISMLSSHARHVLLSLAVAGEPCPQDAIPLDAPDADRDSAALVRLERLGFTTLSERGWSVAHDSVTESALAGAKPDEVREAHARLARAFLSSERATSESSLALRTAVGHAWHAKRYLGECFSRFVAHARRQRDARNLYELAGDALGDLNSPAARSALVASLATRERVRDTVARRWKAGAATAGIAVAASLIGAFVATRSPRVVADAYLSFVQSDTQGVPHLMEVPLLAADWNSNRPIDARDADDVLTLPTDNMSWEPQATGRRAQEWIVTLAQPDSGATDLFLLSKNAPPARLTDTRGDDLEPSVAPDGARVVFSSARWSDRSARSLAILELDSKRVQRLTSSTASDNSPLWSPDGHRVAFTRTTQDSVALCVVHIDGSHLRCLLHAEGQVQARALAWRDENVLLATFAQRYLKLDVDSSTTTVIDSTPGSRVVSRDGRWMAFLETNPTGTSVPSMFVSPALEPQRARLVRLAPGFSRVPSPTWTRSTAVDRMVTAVRIQALTSGPFVGVPYQLRVTARRAAGDSVSLAEITWSTSDSTIADVDSSGTLLPKREGRVTLHASYGGWRTDSMLMVISRASSRVVLAEAWQDTALSRWSAFGDPKPSTVAIVGGFAFANNGDGVFHSGVHTRGVFATTGGLALDTWFEAPITIDRSQSVRIGIFRGIDSVALARWSHHDGWAFAPGREGTTHCEFVYPADAEGMRSYGEHFSIGSRREAAPASWRRGARVSIRLQLLPDGRCASRINGLDAIEPLDWIQRFTETSAAHVFVYGNSPGTRVLVGPLTVTEGVPPGIDWMRAAR